MTWQLSHRADPEVVPLADRHYNRQKIGAPQFAPPGRCIVLKAKKAGVLKAFWITSYPFAAYVRHQWAGAWICSAFRNEGAGLSSQLIREAIAATRYIANGDPVWNFGELPSLGIITFVNPKKIQSHNPGYCYIRAGFRRVGMTEGGLPALQLLPDQMPAPERPALMPLTLFGDSHERIECA